MTQWDNGVHESYVFVDSNSYKPGCRLKIGLVQQSFLLSGSVSQAYTPEQDELPLFYLVQVPVVLTDHLQFFRPVFEQRRVFSRIRVQFIQLLIGNI